MDLKSWPSATIVIALVAAITIIYIVDPTARDRLLDWIALLVNAAVGGAAGGMLGYLAGKRAALRALGK